MPATLPVTVGATYENGTLKLDERLELPEGMKLQVTLGSPLDATDLTIIRDIIAEDREVFEALAR
jgi:predicted DNA-binding antitoxin AbrB/MazE fold protein